MSMQNVRFTVNTGGESLGGGKKGARTIMTSTLISDENLNAGELKDWLHAVPSVADVEITKEKGDDGKHNEISLLAVWVDSNGMYTKLVD